MNRTKANTAITSNEEIADDGDAAFRASLEPYDHRLDALNRVLTSGHFRASERNKQFLKFVVEETVAGRASRIKAFTVAVDVFGRDSSFDASVDPIVRIAAGHLRRSLEEYYAGKGKRDPYKIVLPLGTYAPVFERQDGFPRRVLSQLGTLAVDRQKHLQSGAVSVTMALAAAALGATYFFSPFGAGTNQTPVVVVGKVQAYPSDQRSEAFADLFTQSLWGALSEEKGLRVVGVRPEESLNEVLTRAETTFGGNMPLYQLLSSVRQEGSELRVYWHVLDGRSNESYLSASTVHEIKDEAITTTPVQLADEVAASMKRFSLQDQVEPPEGL